MSPRDEQSKLTPHAILGVVIALLGVIFTLDNLGLADTAAFVRFWPVAPIVVGLIMLMHADTTREWVFGSAWMAAGGVLLARSLGWLDFRLRDFWPLVLVAIGIKLIWQERELTAPSAPRDAEPPDVDMATGFEEDVASEPAPLGPVRFDRPPPIPPPPPQFASAPPPAGQKRGRCSSRGKRGADWRSSAFEASGWTPWLQWEQWQARGGPHWRPRRGHIRMLALMSGIERRLRAEAFASAEMTAIMGACELDLRHAEMRGEEAHISAFALWGGIEIRVPDHWVVVNRSMALMGGVEDTTRHVDDAARPRLVIHGFALMAGIEIKN